MPDRMEILQDLMPDLASRLVLRSDQTPWYARGDCRTSDLPAEAWFPIDRHAEDAQAAREVCHTCPVTDVCQAEAMRMPDTVGIWGGLDEKERDRLIKTERRRQLRITEMRIRIDPPGHEVGQQ